MEDGIQKEYPHNLLFAIRGNSVIELPATLTKDVRSGIAYALSTLEDTERTVLECKYVFGKNINEFQKKIEKKALLKLRNTGRLDYICYGVKGCTKRKAEEAKKKGFLKGYQIGYKDGEKACNCNSNNPESMTMMDFPVDVMQVSTHVCNALKLNGCNNVRDVVMLDEERIQKMPKLGKKGIQEVIRVLNSYEISHTDWYLY